MRLPDFLLIGAAKSGTTALFYYLGQHPDVFACPVREPNFFALEGHVLNFAGPGDRGTVGKNSVTDLEIYGGLFADAEANRLAGEVSPLYLYHEHAPARIKQHLPDAKLIVVLRNPVDRAYASFLHLRRDGREPCTRFEDAITRETTRIQSNWEHLWHYYEMGRYATQLERYFALFDRSQIKLIRYEAFKRSPAEVVRECFDFLGVDNGFEPSFARRPNRSGEPRSRMVQWVIGGRGRLKHTLAQILPESLKGRIVHRIQQINLKQPAMEAEVRQMLQDRYREEIEKLQELTDWDLSGWLAD